MFRTTLILILALTPLTQTVSLWAQDQESAPREDVEWIIEEILRLRGEAESLLEALPPDLREEVERRWQELQATSLEVPAAEESQSEPTVAAPPEPDAGPEDFAPVPAEIAASPEPTPASGPDAELEPALESEAAQVLSEPAKECDSLGPLDTNSDGVISASDRNWRYLRLRADMGSKSNSMGDLESLYDLGFREIDVNLRFYKLADGFTGDITLDDRIRFELLSKRKSGRRSMILFIQASRLARGGDLQQPTSGTGVDGKRLEI